VYRGGILPIEETPVAVKGPTGLDANIPVAFSLSQNYPNPFNPSTTIEFQVHLAGETSLDIYDLSGRIINTLMHEYLAPNRYSVVWDGRDISGRLVPSGIYIYSIISGIQHEAKRMVFLK
jgi:hypothetical protein